MMQEEDKKRRETSMKNLIGYEWKEASNGATIEVVNPATQELIDTSPLWGLSLFRTYQSFVYYGR